MSEVEVEEGLAADLIWGAAEISKLLNLSERQVYYQADKKLLPIGRVGDKLVASRRKLRKHFAKLTSGAEPGPSSLQPMVEAAGMHKLMLRWQQKIREKLTAEPPEKRAELFAQLTLNGVPPIAFQHPFEAARAIEDIRREFGISEEQIDNALRAMGVPVDAQNKVLDELIDAGVIKIVS